MEACKNKNWLNLEHCPNKRRNVWGYRPKCPISGTKIVSISYFDLSVPSFGIQREVLKFGTISQVSQFFVNLKCEGN